MTPALELLEEFFYIVKSLRVIHKYFFRVTFTSVPSVLTRPYTAVAVPITKSRRANCLAAIVASGGYLLSAPALEM